MIRARPAAWLGFAACLLSAAAHAATRSDYEAALAAAQAAEQRAQSLQNRWSTTESDLAAARKAASGKDYDQATALAKRARSLAELSIAQAQQQDTAWRNEVVR